MGRLASLVLLSALQLLPSESFRIKRAKGNLVTGAVKKTNKAKFENASAESVSKSGGITSSSGINLAGKVFAALTHDFKGDGRTATRYILQTNEHKLPSPLPEGYKGFWTFAYQGQHTLWRATEKDKIPGYARGEIPPGTHWDTDDDINVGSFILKVNEKLHVCMMAYGMDSYDGEALHLFHNKKYNHNDKYGQIGLESKATTSLPKRWNVVIPEWDYEDKPLYEDEWYAYCGVRGSGNYALQLQCRDYKGCYALLGIEKLPKCDPDNGNPHCAPMPNGVDDPEYPQ